MVEYRHSTAANLDPPSPEHIKKREGWACGGSEGGDIDPHHQAGIIITQRFKLDYRHRYAERYGAQVTNRQRASGFFQARSSTGTVTIRRIIAGNNNKPHDGFRSMGKKMHIDPAYRYCTRGNGQPPNSYCALDRH